jgi:hypothetical protein
MYATGPRAKLGFRVTSSLVSNTSRLPRDVCLGEYHLHSYTSSWVEVREARKVDQKMRILD